MDFPWPLNNKQGIRNVPPGLFYSHVGVRQVEEATPRSWLCKHSNTEKSCLANNYIDTQGQIENIPLNIDIEQSSDNGLVVLPGSP